MANKPAKGTPLPVQTHTWKYKQHADIARLYLQGHTQVEIAKQVGITVLTVKSRLSTIREQWKRSAMIDFNERQANELEKIDALEQVYLSKFEESCQDGHKHIKKSFPMYRKRDGGLYVDDEGKLKQNSHYKQVMQVVEETHTVEKRVGDPRWLDGVRNCIDMRCKIFGLYRTQHEKDDGRAPGLAGLNQKGRVAFFLAVLEQWRDDGSNGKGEVLRGQ